MLLLGLVIFETLLTLTQILLLETVIALKQLLLKAFISFKQLRIGTALNWLELCSSGLTAHLFFEVSR